MYSYNTQRKLLHIVDKEQQKTIQKVWENQFCLSCQYSISLFSAHTLLPAEFLLPCLWFLLVGNKKFTIHNRQKNILKLGH